MERFVHQACTLFVAASVTCLVACADDSPVAWPPGDHEGLEAAPQVEPEDPALLEPFYASGDRIQVEVYEDPSGGHSFRRLIDAQLGTPCEILPTDGGRLHCVPYGSFDEYRGEDCDDLFLGASDPRDEACVDTPFARLRNECGDEYGAHALTLPDEQPLAVWQLEKEYFDSTNHEPQHWEWVCEGPEDAPKGVTLFERGPRIADDELVEFTIVEEFSATGLGAQFYVGDDGSRVYLSMTDVTRGECSRTLTIDGAWRCVPWHPGTSADDAEYGTPDCTGPAVFHVSVGDCAGGLESDYVSFHDPEAGGSTIHHVGEQVEGPIYEMTADGDCRLSNSSDYSGWIWFEIGEVVSPQEFPAIHESSATANGLERRWFTSTSGVRVASGDYYDPTSGEDCYLRAVPDDSDPRCVPLEPSPEESWLVFGDQDCQVPLLNRPSGATDTAEGDVFSIGHGGLQEQGCAQGALRLGLFTTWELGPLVPQPDSIYRLDKGFCKEQWAQEPNSEYRALSPHPSADYPRFEITTAP